jgi:curved DNA-binding protein CbpA
MEVNFNNLKYNLYELLNVDNTASNNEIESKYRNIIKNFHPDKKILSELEEAIYYEITQAYQILKDLQKRKKYDIFLNNQNNFNNTTDFDYNNIKNESSSFFPDTKEQATKSYLEHGENVYKKHIGVNIQNPKEQINKLLKNKSKERENIIPIKKELFKSSEDFNNIFTDRKVYGNYSDNIIKYTSGQIIPLELGKSSLNLTSLKDFHNMYSKDTVIEKNMTSMSHAFLLQPHKKINEEFDYDEKITSRPTTFDEYDNANNTSFNF